MADPTETATLPELLTRYRNDWAVDQREGQMPFYSIDEHQRLVFELLEDAVSAGMRMSNLYELAIKGLQNTTDTDETEAVLEGVLALHSRDQGRIWDLCAHVVHVLAALQGDPLPTKPDPLRQIKWKAAAQV